MIAFVNNNLCFSINIFVLFKLFTITSMFSFSSRKIPSINFLFILILINFDLYFLLKFFANSFEFCHQYKLWQNNFYLGFQIF